MTSPRERGNGPVEFSLVSMLVVAVTLATLQVAFIAHVRAIATDAAIDGAAHAALADSTNDDGVSRTIALLSVGLASDLVREVVSRDGTLDGRPIVTVDVTLANPIIGPWLAVAETTVSGRAFREIPRPSH